MYSAHLVFGDINGHSRLRLGDRATRLKTFWKICEQQKPATLPDSKESFYDLDNDSLMAGFSNLRGFIEGADVVAWTAELAQKLNRSGVRVSFGVNLVAYSGDLPWEIKSGLKESAGEIHLDDTTHRQLGRVVRSRLVGDPLIVAARLVELAKKRGATMALSAHNGGRLDDGIESLRRDARLQGYLFHEMTEYVDSLGAEKGDWLRLRIQQIFAVSQRMNAPI